MGQKLYFDENNTERCYTLDWHVNDLQNSVDGETERVLIEAERVTGEQFFFCKAFQEIGEVGSCKGCALYAPNNGKSGRCRDYGYCYEATEKTKTIKRK